MVEGQKYRTYEGGPGVLERIHYITMILALNRPPHPPHL